MSGIKLSKEEQQELFGDGFSDEYAVEAKEGWGGTDAWKQSQRRTTKYTKEDWARIKAEMEAARSAFVAAMDAGLPATSDAAMDAAELSRLQIDKWFYDVTPEFHRKLGDMYRGDPRFTKTYEDIRAGMARYIRDAIHANADRAESAANNQS